MVRGIPITTDGRPFLRWFFTVYSLIGAALMIGLASLLGGDTVQIRALAHLPRAGAGGPHETGAIFAGLLVGPTDVTPLGHEAIGWIGVVTVTHRQGKSTTTTERCRRGMLTGLSLRPDGVDGLVSLVTPLLRAIDYKDKVDSFGGGWRSAPHYRLGQSLATSSIPDDVVEACHIAPAELAHDRWSYEEHWAAPGTHVEIAGCLAAGSITACDDGPAIGHLSADGVHAMARRLADDTMLIATLTALVATMFAVFGCVGALRELRRPARHAGWQ